MRFHYEVLPEAVGGVEVGGKKYKAGEQFVALPADVAHVRGLLKKIRQEKPYSWEKENEAGAAASADGSGPETAGKE